MAGLVEQLQADALDANVPVSTLLRKVKVCAAKLGLQDALTWVASELNGYTCAGDEMPEYRVGHGITKVQDQLGRWVPVRIDSSKIANGVSKVYFREPVSNLEELLRHDVATFDHPLDHELVTILDGMSNLPIVAARNTVSRGQLHEIVQKVRDLVLDWALELSRAGVTGEGMSFTDNERDRASGAHISIGTFHGSFSTGNVSGDGAQLNQSYSHVTNEASVISELIDAARHQVADSAEREAIISAAKELADAKDKPTMLQAYERLLASAANHMTLLAPFLPALGQLISA